MACVEQVEAELKHKARVSMAQAKTPLEKIQARMLARGPACFKTFQRRFLIMDNDRSKRLNLEEFMTGLRDIGVVISKEEFEQAFNNFDKDNSGGIDMTEFVTRLRPPMNNARVNLVTRCFMMMDKTGDGQIGVDDLVGSYEVKKHPKYISGEWTRDQVYRAFLKSFEAEENVDGIVTQEEFLSYYACLSASIDHDAYFTLMMQNSWKHLDLRA